MLCSLCSGSAYVGNTYYHIAKIGNNDDGSGSEGEPYRQVYEESDDENVNQVRLNQVYVKMKENQSESFIPFNVKEKHQKPTIANIALFAPEPTVFYAN